ncbi:MAG: hypothetical protein WCD89_08400 [Anaerocolumna sp.]
MVIKMMQDKARGYKSPLAVTAVGNADRILQENQNFVNQNTLTYKVL